jgi:hypothetical protein
LRVLPSLLPVPQWWQRVLPSWLPVLQWCCYLRRHHRTRQQ